MQLNGFGQGIAHIDLSSGSVELRPVPEEWVRKFVGGRGLGVRYLLENGPEVEPLSPENLLCFMNGPLSGSEASMSGRWACVTKSPLTGTVTDSHQGGWTGARLRWAGLDGLIFQGRAERPVYAFVEDGQVSLRDASEVWGKGVHETVAFFRERYGAKNLSVCAIGQAGECGNLYAAWVNEDDRAFGRGGTGTVGGSKQLKAIVIRASRSKGQVPDAERWKQVRKQTLDILRDESKITSPKKGGLSVYGTNVLMNIVSNIGALGTNNSRETSFGEKAEKISGEYVQEHILVNDPTCHACPVACKKEVEIKEGPYAGLRMESVEYEPAWSLGANCGNDDIGSIARMIDDCNDYGMDPIELGNAFSMYMEATEQGWVQGKGLLWGDHAGMVAMIEAIALRQGEGELLADGPARAAEKLGHPEIAMTVKGQAVAAPATCAATWPPPSSGCSPSKRTRWSGRARASWSRPSRTSRPSPTAWTCASSARSRKGRRTTPRSTRPRWASSSRSRTCWRRASASTTWSVTTTTWPASARARTPCPSASSRSPPRWRAPRATSPSWARCSRSTTRRGAGRTAWFPSPS